MKTSTEHQNRWNLFWNRIRNHVGRRRLKPADNKGFSLVELIIVIAIMAILAASLAPALIRYINKARKADDIADAEVIGKSLSLAVASDEDLYDFLLYSAAELSKQSATAEYRMLAMSSVSGAANHPTTWFVKIANVASAQSANLNKMIQFLNDEVGPKIVKIHFGKVDILDQWVVCCDRNCNLAVFVTAGISGNYHIGKSVNGYRQIGGQGNVVAYKLWPEVQPEYEELSSLNEIPDRSSSFH